MDIRFASILDFNDVIDFFEKYLDEKNKAIYSLEFLCPFGVRGAISRKQIIIARDDENRIVGALRFYKRKKEDVVSLYQFAIDENYRGKQLLKEMLNKIDSNKVIVQCPKDIDFNNYYKKMGWKIDKEDGEYNFWRLDNKN